MKENAYPHHSRSKPPGHRYNAKVFLFYSIFLSSSISGQTLHMHTAYSPNFLYSRGGNKKKKKIK
jgi:hypothetical protein